MSATPFIVRESETLARLTGMIATHCCICSRPLSDPVSVEMGIGPVCADRYMKQPMVPPTQDEIESARGDLITGDIDGLIPIGVMDHLMTLTSGYEMARVLTYMASFHYRKKPFVLHVAKVVKALGYVTLGERLETERTPIRVTTSKIDPGTMIVVLPRCEGRNWMHLSTEMAHLHGVKVVKTPGGGRIKHYEVSRKGLHHLKILLGAFFGNQEVFVSLDSKPSKIVGISPRTLEHLRAFRTPALPGVLPGASKVPAPPAVPPGNAVGVRFEILPVGPVLEVYTPYNPDFVSALKDTKNIKNYKDRRWNPSLQCWEVAPAYGPLVKSLIQAHYGVTI